ncbi:MAG: 16S rRNA (guanine(527)-N(7))-methyltransferase RsmG [Betaproteobacteria bacterium]|nr:16S rRNA (guanine(527)-N(7))-methyltransferase RsmG [Betaproteobacteria bacterium]
MTPAQRLDSGLAALALDLGPAARQRLLTYTELLLKWNRVYSLTAICHPGRIVTHHLLDSLAVLPHVREPRLADIGSGAGLPGIPLAIANPDLSVILVEANQKKCAFLEQARIDLELGNLTIVRERIEHWRPPDPLPAAISRAFSELSVFAEHARHVLAPGGVLYAMKGQRPVEEMKVLPAHLHVARIVDLRVPGIDAARCLLTITTED